MTTLTGEVSPSSTSRKLPSRVRTPSKVATSDTPASVLAARVYSRRAESSWEAELLGLSTAISRTGLLLLLLPPTTGVGKVMGADTTRGLTRLNIAGGATITTDVGTYHNRKVDCYKGVLNRIHKKYRGRVGDNGSGHGRAVTVVDPLAVTVAALVLLLPLLKVLLALELLVVSTKSSGAYIADKVAR